MLDMLGLADNHSAIFHEVPGLDEDVAAIHVLHLTLLVLGEGGGCEGGRGEGVRGEGRAGYVKVAKTGENCTYDIWASYHSNNIFSSYGCLKQQQQQTNKQTNKQKNNFQKLQTPSPLRIVYASPLLVGHVTVT